MSDLRMPIKTIKEGEKTTKICVEDVYKMLNRLQGGLDSMYNNSVDIIDSIHKEYDGFEGELIIGTGISKPCSGDTYNEEIGNEIAFRKAKLNANFKKARIIEKIWKELGKMSNICQEEYDRLMYYVDDDIHEIRKYNPEYLK